MAKRKELEQDFCFAVTTCGGEEESVMDKINEARNLPQTNKCLSAIREAHLAVLKIETAIRAEERKHAEAARLEKISTVSAITALFVYMSRYGITVWYRMLRYGMIHIRMYAQVYHTYL